MGWWPQISRLAGNAYGVPRYVPDIRFGLFLPEPERLKAVGPRRKAGGGRPSPGQSEAPPWVAGAYKKDQALKGRNLECGNGLCRPFRAHFKNIRHPGRRFALPWAARPGCPCGAAKPLRALQARPRTTSLSLSTGHWGQSPISASARWQSPGRRVGCCHAASRQNRHSGLRSPHGNLGTPYRLIMEIWGNLGTPYSFCRDGVVTKGMQDHAGTATTTDPKVPYVYEDAATGRDLDARAFRFLRGGRIPGSLGQLCRSAAAGAGIAAEIVHLQSLRPGRARPTHRLPSFAKASEGCASYRLLTTTA
jgi:hypothetical protein